VQERLDAGKEPIDYGGEEVMFHCPLFEMVVETLTYMEAMYRSIPWPFRKKLKGG
jgi:hypothetical protein